MVLVILRDAFKLVVYLPNSNYLTAIASKSRDNFFIFKIIKIVLSFLIQRELLICN
jgi:hypothetical protein